MVHQRGPSRPRGRIIRSITPLRAVFVGEGGNTWECAFICGLWIRLSVWPSAAASLWCVSWITSSLFSLCFTLLREKGSQRWRRLSAQKLLTAPTHDAICNGGRLTYIASYIISINTRALNANTHNLGIVPCSGGRCGFSVRVYLLWRISSAGCMYAISRCSSTVDVELYSDRSLNFPIYLTSYEMNCDLWP